jgi:hypothetical protein
MALCPRCVVQLGADHADPALHAVPRLCNGRQHKAAGGSAGVIYGATAGVLWAARCYSPAPRGLVAQLVEQRIENPRVGGSIPPQATKVDRGSIRCDGLLFTSQMVLSSWLVRVISAGLAQLVERYLAKV